MKVTRLFALGALSLILTGGLAAGVAVAQPVMKAGTATINDVQHEYLKRFAERIAKQAPQKLKVEVYPAEQLGNNARMLEGLTLGTVEAVIGPPEFIVGVDPRFQIVGAPGLVKDMQHAVRLTQDAKFRDALGANPTVVLTPSPFEPCLRLYPLPTWEDLERKISALPSDSGATSLSRLR